MPLYIQGIQLKSLTEKYELKCIQTYQQFEYIKQCKQVIKSTSNSNAMKGLEQFSDTHIVHFYIHPCLTLMCM